MKNKVILITGAGRRLGAAMARKLHANGANVIIHYRNSDKPANALCDELNAQRARSASTVHGDLNDLESIETIAADALSAFDRLDGLINNASSFFPTPIGTATADQWDDLIGSNMRAPFFLTQALAPALRKQQGAIINMLDIHASRPLRNHPVYCAAKAGQLMLTQSLAKELAPDVRVNGIAPGPVMWPENGMSESAKSAIVQSTLLKRHGDPEDIATAALYLMRDATFVTGQILAVDGGRSLRS